MPDNTPRVLIISSVDPTQGTGTVALNFYKVLKAQGIDVDILTKYPVPGHPEFLYVVKQMPDGSHSIEDEVMAWQHRKSLRIASRICQQGNHAFDYPKETTPPVSPWMVTRKIQKPYDVVIIVFWYQLLSYQTVQAIYDKLHCQIHFRCPDNQPIAGGCHFIGNCERLSEGCGSCPGLQNSGPHDFTAFNVRYRGKVLAHVRPIVFGNTHMQMIHRKSALLREYDRLETVYPLVDNDFFHPIDKQEARRAFDITPNKRFILFFGCSLLNEERKGMKYLLQALRLFHDGLTEQQRAEVLLVVAGNYAEDLLRQLPFDYQFIGFVAFEKLPLVYSLANAFLCPSVDDAGPSMVNQSLSCGTPVVAFNIGTALDMVQGHNTGYCAELRDVEDYANGIRHIYTRSSEEYRAMCLACRDLALERTTSAAFVKSFVNIYSKYSANSADKTFHRSRFLVGINEKMFLLRAYTRSILALMRSSFGHKARHNNS